MNSHWTKLAVRSIQVALCERQRRWKLGDHPTVSLAEARKRAHHIKLRVSNGIAPQQQKQQA